MTYFAASVDDVETDTKFAQHLGVDFPILADPDKKTAKEYGVLSAMGFASRWTFYIGKDGRILYIDQSVKPATAGADVAARLAALGVEKKQKPS